MRQLLTTNLLQITPTSLRTYGTASDINLDLYAKGVGVIINYNAVQIICTPKYAGSSLTPIMYFDYNTVLTSTGYGPSYALYVSNGDIWLNGGTFASSSDKRIKKNIKNVENSLEIIKKIKPRQFNYIDNVNNNTSNQYGFIAQEIEQIIPEAVSNQKHYIPNIFSVGICSNNVITISSNILPIDLTNSNIKITDYAGNENICQIENITSSNSFSINSNISTSEVFIYGTEVNDFKTIDKDTIFTYNVSATQELSRKIDALMARIEYLENIIYTI